MLAGYQEQTMSKKRDGRKAGNGGKKVGRCVKIYILRYIKEIL